MRHAQRAAKRRVRTHPALGECGLRAPCATRRQAARENPPRPWRVWYSRRAHWPPRGLSRARRRAPLGRPVPRTETPCVVRAASAARVAVGISRCRPSWSDAPMRAGPSRRSPGAARFVCSHPLPLMVAPSVRRAARAGLESRDVTRAPSARCGGAKRSLWWEVCCTGCVPAVTGRVSQVRA